MGRPRREEVKPERVMVFHTDTGELRKVDVPVREEPEPEQKSEKKPEPETKIQVGSFLVSFN